MNVELVDPAVLARASALIAKGTGPELQDGIAQLLEAKEAYAKNPDSTGGKNCSMVLSKALKTLTDEPYLALGFPANGAGIEESAVKKSYHKLALKYHPDKNRATALLFQTILAAYTILTDSEKRAAFEAKKKRQEESLERLRKKREEEVGVGAGGRPSRQEEPKEAPQMPRRQSYRSSTGATGPTPQEPSVRRASTTSPEPPNLRRASASSMPQPQAQQPSQPQVDPDEKLREFNKKFYDEFRKAAKSGAFKQQQQQQQPSGAGFTAAEPSKPQAPPRPKGLRSTGRTDTTVTLEWAACPGQGTIAYELQWRERGQNGQAWETAQQLLLGTTCLKKNLTPSVCYEFRIRAASAWGWSGYSDPIMVLTAAASNGTSSSPNSARSSEAGLGLGKDRARSAEDKKKAKEDDASPWTWKDGQEASKAPPEPAPAQSWMCTVCRRENVAGADACVVCFTRKDYKSERLHKRNPSPPPPQPAEAKKPPRAPNTKPTTRRAESTPAQEVETDDEAHEDAWEFTEDDVPAQEVEENVGGYPYYDGYEETSDTGLGVYRLNTQVTKLHNVRAEPIKKARVVGHLLSDRDIFVEAEVGPWLKVIFHQPYTDESTGLTPLIVTNTGWCLKEGAGVTYLVKVDNPQNQAQAQQQGYYGSNRTSGGGSQDGGTSTDTEGEQDYWYELKDENGDTYYFNSGTGGSQWECPPWFDEVDPESGAVYYRNSATGEAQWEKPDGFIPVMRAEAYSTPEAEFVKSMLSPKRSSRNMMKPGMKNFDFSGVSSGVVF